MDEFNYKQLQHESYNNLRGGTIGEPALVLMPLFLTTYFSSTFQTTIVPNLLSDFIFLVLPLVFNLTLASDIPHFITFTIVLAIIAHRIVCLPSKPSHENILSTAVEPKPAWITSFRACTNLMTIVCILAVDLSIFPRRFAKTETYGFGLMDLGVGFFAVCNGLVYNVKGRIKKEISTMSVLAVIGLVRIGMVALLGYHEHVTEYGAHWNFFITLSLCRFVVLILRLSFNLNPLVLALSFLTFQQVILASGFEEWIIGDTLRNNFISANREGIFSISGYLTLFYASAAFSSFVENKELYKLILRTLCITVVTASLTLLMRNSVSRRLCNVGYVFWTLSMAGLSIVVLNLIHVALKKPQMPVPTLFLLINRHSLLFFLVGNILTGLSNFAFQTLLLSQLQSYCLLLSYTAAVILIIYFYDRKT